MISSKNFFLILMSLCLIAFSSCEKEDIDMTTIDEEEPPVEVVNCDDLSVELEEIEGTVTATVNGGVSSYTYAWSTGETSASISVEEDGMYSVTVTDSQECTSTQTLEVTLPVIVECNNDLNFEAPDFANSISFAESGVAFLWTEDCSEDTGLSSFAYNYLIIDADWDIWGTGEEQPHPLWIHDGMPGICFGSDEVPQAGDVLSSYIPDALFQDVNTNTRFDLDDVEITITAASAEEGVEVSGTISGILRNQEETESSVITGSFCVSLVSVCNN